MKKLLVISSIVLALSVQNQVMAKDVSSTTMGQKLDDAAIVAVVNTDFMKDKELSAIKINVDSTKGNVILRGAAPNHNAMERATRIAKSVEGVVSVDNRITLDGGDSMISAHDKHVMRENMNTTYNEVKHDAAVTGYDVKVGTNNMLDKAGEKIDDAAINVAINAKLKCF